MEEWTSLMDLMKTLISCSFSKMRHHFFIPFWQIVAHTVPFYTGSALTPQWLYSVYPPWWFNLRLWAVKQWRSWAHVERLHSPSNSSGMTYNRRHRRNTVESCVCYAVGCRRYIWVTHQCQGTSAAVNERHCPRHNADVWPRTSGSALWQ